VLVRIAERMSLLSARQRAYFAEVSDEVGRQVGGWAKSVRSR